MGGGVLLRISTRLDGAEGLEEATLVGLAVGLAVEAAIVEDPDAEVMMTLYLKVRSDDPEDRKADFIAIELSY